MHRPSCCHAQNLPRSNDPHKLMWKLWKFPDGPAEGEVEVRTGPAQGGRMLLAPCVAVV